MFRRDIHWLGVLVLIAVMLTGVIALAACATDDCADHCFDHCTCHTVFLTPTTLAVPAVAGAESLAHRPDTLKVRLVCADIFEPPRL